MNTSQDEQIKKLEKKIQELEEKLQIYGMTAASAYAQQRFAARGGKYRLNVIKPRKFNEKLIWLRENYWAYNPITYYLNDKYFFKYFFEKLWGEEHSIKLLGIWDNVEDIDFQSLPQKFVLKRTLSGGSFEVKLVDKNKDDLNEIKRIAKTWFVDKERVSARIIAERQLERQPDGNMFDYKFFCFNGKVKFIYVLRNKLGDKKRFHCYYDLNWKKIPVRDYHPYIEDEIEKPKLLNEMIAFSEKIGKMFPVIRVDMYIEGDNFYIGELTDVSNEGMCPLDPIAYDRKWGDMIKLPNKKEIEENYNDFLEYFPELKENPIYLRTNMSVYNIFYPDGKSSSILPVPPLPFTQPMKNT